MLLSAFARIECLSLEVLAKSRLNSNRTCPCSPIQNRPSLLGLRLGLSLLSYTTSFHDNALNRVQCCERLIISSLLRRNLLYFFKCIEPLSIGLFFNRLASSCYDCRQCFVLPFTRTLYVKSFVLVGLSNMVGDFHSVIFNCKLCRRREITCLDEVIVVLLCPTLVSPHSCTIWFEGLPSHSSISDDLCRYRLSLEFFFMPQFAFILLIATVNLCQGHCLVFFVLIVCGVYVC
jgi:hypothetical protein